MLSLKSTDTKTWRQRVRNSLSVKPTLRPLLQLAQKLQEKRVKLKLRKDEVKRLVQKGQDILRNGKQKLIDRLLNARAALKLTNERNAVLVSTTAFACSSLLDSSDFNATTDASKSRCIHHDTLPLVTSKTDVNSVASLLSIDTSKCMLSAAASKSKLLSSTPSSPSLSSNIVRSIPVTPFNAAPLIEIPISSPRVNNHLSSQDRPAMDPNMSSLSLSSGSCLSTPSTEVITDSELAEIAVAELEDTCQKCSSVLLQDDGTKCPLHDLQDIDDDDFDDCVDLLEPTVRVQLTPGVPSWIKSFTNVFSGAEGLFWSMFSHSIEPGLSSPLPWCLPQSQDQQASASIREQVLDSPVVQSASKVCRNTATLNVLESDGEQKLAASILDSMRARMNPLAVRLFGLMLGTAFSSAFSKLVIHNQSRIQALYRMQQVSKDLSIVLVPTHKSHLDYLLMSYVCFAFGLKMPHIAAGDNLNLPVIGTYLRMCGAFFIRRSFRPSTSSANSTGPLAKTITSTYTQLLIQERQTLEFFIEGGRSRNGRIRPPRLGFVSWTVEAALSALLHSHERASGINQASVSQAPNVLLIPISIAYDQVFESDSYVREAVGHSKKSESIAQVASSILSLLSGAVSTSSCEPSIGEVHVRFGSPVSVRAVWLQLFMSRFRFLEDIMKPVRFGLNGDHQQQRIQRVVSLVDHYFQSAPSLSHTVVDVSARVANQVMESLSDETPVSATSLLAYVLTVPLHVLNFNFTCEHAPSVNSFRLSNLDFLTSRRALLLAQSVYRVCSALGSKFVFRFDELPRELNRAFRLFESSGLIHSLPQVATHHACSETPHRDFALLLSPCPEHRLRLNYCRNSLLQSVFLSSLLASAAFEVAVLDSNRITCQIDRSAMIMKALELGNLLRAELPFAAPLYDNLTEFTSPFFFSFFFFFFNKWLCIAQV